MERNVPLPMGQVGLEPTIASSNRFTDGFLNPFGY